MDFLTKTFPNGIRLLHIPATGPVAHLAVYINAGTRDEEKDENGMAHFIEHTIFKGTAKRRAYHILTRLESVGGELNAFTTKEETCIYASFLREHFFRAIELTADILTRSAFPDKELKKEKDVILDEINSYKDNPAEEIYDVLEENVFRDHPLGLHILGTPEHLVAFSRANVLEFIRKHYTGRNMVICTGGELAFNRICRAVEKLFEAIPESSPAKNRQPFDGYKPFNSRLARTTFQTHCMIANIAFDRHDPKRFPLYLLNNILGGPAMNSRLNLSVRERYGYAYSVESAFLPYTDTGIFSIYLGTDNGNLDKSLALINRELEKFRMVPLGSLQLSQAKKQLIGQIEVANESNLNHLLAAGKAYLHDDRLESPEEIRRKIEEITTAQLIETARRILDPGELSMLIFQNPLQ